MKAVKNKKIIPKQVLKKSAKQITETQFWKQVALQQQAFLHAKHQT